jgi:hypothetical protein
MRLEAVQLRLKTNSCRRCAAATQRLLRQFLESAPRRHRVRCCRSKKGRRYRRPPPRLDDPFVHLRGGGSCCCWPRGGRAPLHNEPEDRSSPPSEKRHIGVAGRPHPINRRRRLCPRRPPGGRAGGQLAGRADRLVLDLFGRRLRLQYPRGSRQRNGAAEDIVDHQQRFAVLQGRLRQIAVASKSKRREAPCVAEAFCQGQLFKSARHCGLDAQALAGEPAKSDLFRRSELNR